MRPRAVRKILATKHQGVLTTKGTEKRAIKNMQLLLQHCCKTSWKAMLHVLPCTHVQTCQQPDLVQDRFHEGGKTRNVALQLVL